MTVHNYRSRQVHKNFKWGKSIQPFQRSAFRKVWTQFVPKFDKFLAHGQAHMGQMAKWPWQCTTTGLDNSTELRIEKIRQAVTEIWVPQVWQPPAQPPNRPPVQPPTRPPARTVTTILLQPRGLRGKNVHRPVLYTGPDPGRHQCLQMV